MFRTTVIALLTSLVGGSSVASTNEVVHHEHHAISRHGELEILVWLSEDILNAASQPAGFPDQWWPAVERNRQAIAQWHLRRPTGAGGCVATATGEPSFDDLAKKKGATTDRYLTLLASSRLVVVADVESVDPGVLVVGEGAVAPRVRVSVSEVLRDVGGSLRPGDELIFMGRGGAVSIGHERVCMVEEPELSLPEPGSRVVLNAFTLDSDPLKASGPGAVIHPSTVFTVKGDSVALPANSRFEESAIHLEAIRTRSGALYAFDVSAYVTGDGTYSAGFANSNPSYSYIWSRDSSNPPVLEVSFEP